MNAQRGYPACNYLVLGIKLLFALEKRRDIYTKPQGCMSKPPSAIMVSPTSYSPSKPLRLTISLSNNESGKRLEVKVSTPDGDMPTKALYVLWFLQCKNVNC